MGILEKPGKELGFWRRLQQFVQEILQRALASEPAESTCCKLRRRTAKTQRLRKSNKITFAGVLQQFAASLRAGQQTATKQNAEKGRNQTVF